MSKLRLSVAMCTYNGARFLGQQLESIAAQTRLPDELIVCDDQSTDESIEIIKSFARHAPFPVRVESNEKNLGVTKNFEKTIGLCAGDVIALSDQDDVWHPEKLIRSESILCQRPSVGLVFTDADVVDEGLTPLDVRLWDWVRFARSERKSVLEGHGLEVLLNHNVVTGATMVFRATFKPLVLPIPGIWVHDGWIALLICVRAELALIPDPLISYRKHALQQTGLPDLTFAGRLEAARRNRSAEYWEELQRYAMAIGRLEQSNSEFDLSSVRSQFCLKTMHLCARARMPRRRVQRLAPVFRELATMRYRRFSRGWRSAVSDLAV